MEEIEVPTENLQEEIHHQASHSPDPWISWVALTSAILAVFAAITALLSGHHANEAMVEQIRSSDTWAFFQAKGLKESLLSTKMELLKAGGHAIAPKDEEKLETYAHEKEKLQEEAKEKEIAASKHFAHHMVFARGVTLFQIAIAIAAISALLRKKNFWLLGLGFGLAGLGFLIQGLFFVS